MEGCKCLSDNTATISLESKAMQQQTSLPPHTLKNFFSMQCPKPLARLMFITGFHPTSIPTGILCGYPSTLCRKPLRHISLGILCFPITIPSQVFAELLGIFLHNSYPKSLNLQIHKHLFCAVHLIRGSFFMNTSQDLAMDKHKKPSSLRKLTFLLLV